MFSLTIFYISYSTNITAEGSNIISFHSTFMFYNLKHIYLEFCEPENNDPLFVSDVLATFLAQCESERSGQMEGVLKNSEVWGQ